MNLGIMESIPGGPHVKCVKNENKTKQNKTTARKKKQEFVIFLCQFFDLVIILAS